MPDPTGEFSDHIVVVTGASRGIGAATALAFAQAGSNIMIASLPAVSIPPVVAEIKTLGVSAEGLAVDVSKEEQVQNLVKVTLEQFGRVDAQVVVVLRAEPCDGPALRLGDLAGDQVGVDVIASAVLADANRCIHPRIPSLPRNHPGRWCRSPRYREIHGRG